MGRDGVRRGRGLIHDGTGYLVGFGINLMNDMEKM